MKYKYPIIIAEIGVNHNGNKKTLNQLIEKVSSTGVDYIKFQSFITENIVIKKSPKANYQKKIKLSQFDMLKKYELKKKGRSFHDIIFNIVFSLIVDNKRELFNSNLILFVCYFVCVCVLLRLCAASLVCCFACVLLRLATSFVLG